jgi:hypothetical protein
LRVVQHGGEEHVGVEEERGRVGIAGREVHGKAFDVRIESGDVGLFEREDVGTLLGGERGAIENRGYVDEEEVARAGCAELVDDVRVDGEDFASDGGGVGVLLRVADVVDADLDGEEGRGRGLGDEGLVAVDREELSLDLLLE